MSVASGSAEEQFNLRDMSLANYPPPSCTPTDTITYLTTPD